MTSVFQKKLGLRRLGFDAWASYSKQKHARSLLLRLSFNQSKSSLRQREVCQPTQGSTFLARVKAAYLLVSRTRQFLLPLCIIKAEPANIQACFFPARSILHTF